VAKLIRHLLPVITALHRAVFRLSGGRIGTRLFGLRFLVLEHVGRRTGARRETPLLYIEHDGAFLVVASNAGRDYAPAWWLNLQAKPDVAVRIGGGRVAVAARRASSEEALRLWPVVIATFSWFEEYRAGTMREIPLVLLEPRTSGTPRIQARAETASSRDGTLAGER